MLERRSRRIRTMQTNGESKDAKLHNLKRGANNTSTLSIRGKKALTPFSPYIQAVNDAKKNQWSPTNLDGYFVVNIFILIFSFLLCPPKLSWFDTIA